MNRKNVECALKNKKNLKNTRKGIYFNENLCRNYREIWYKCRSLHSDQKIHSYFTYSGTVFYRISESAKPVRVDHITDLDTFDTESKSKNQRIRVPHKNFRHLSSHLCCDKSAPWRDSKHYVIDLLIDRLVRRIRMFSCHQSPLAGTKKTNRDRMKTFEWSIRIRRKRIRNTFECFYVTKLPLAGT